MSNGSRQLRNADNDLLGWRGSTATSVAIAS